MKTALMALTLAGTALVNILCAAAALALPRAEPESLGISPARLALISDTLAHYVDAGHIPGLVAGIARHGQVVYLESMGWQDLEQQIPMRTDAMFQIRSMSKPITSLAIMQLEADGRLDLSDPVANYIPAFADIQVYENAADVNGPTRSAARPITVADLLLHTGGLSHRNSALYRERDVRSRADTLAQLVDKVAAVPLLADPGESWNYSISTTVLGRIVEIVSGRPFDEYLQASVFDPLRMQDTGFYIPESKLAQQVHIYQLQPDGMQRMPEMEIPVTVKPPLLEGAAGMVSTVPDYLRFLQAFMNQGELDGNRVLSTDNVERMISNQLPDSVLPIALSPQRPLHDLGWGYGFSVVIDPSKSDFARNQGEFGWNGSLGTFSWADPHTGVVAVLMLQIQPAGAYNLAALFKSLLAQSITD